MGYDKKRIIDAHVHFDMKCDNPVKNIEQYLSFVDKAVLIINTIDEYNEYKKLLESGYELNDICVIIGLNKNDMFIEKENNTQIHGIKIHPRLFGMTKEDIDWYVEKAEAIDPKIIVVDDFYYGSDVDEELYLTIITQLAKRFPEKKIVVAHSGGVNLLKHVMHTKTYMNIYYDISMTINYLKYSSVMDDLTWMCNFMHNRTMLGSDYPDFTINQAMKELDGLHLKEDVVSDVAFRAAESVYFE